jgi:hypothetical protein
MCFPEPRSSQLRKLDDCEYALRSAIPGRPKLEGILVKIAQFILLGSCALAIAVPVTQAQTRHSYEDPVWVTTKDVEVLMAEMRSRIEQDRLMEPVGDSALDVLRAMRDQRLNSPEVQELLRDLSDRLLDKGKAAMRAQAFERSAQLLRVAREVGASLNDSALEQAESELSTARKQYVEFKLRTEQLEKRCLDGDCKR